MAFDAGSVEQNMGEAATLPGQVRVQGISFSRFDAGRHRAGRDWVSHDCQYISSDGYHAVRLISGQWRVYPNGYEPVGAGTFETSGCALNWLADHLRCGKSLEGEAM